MANKLYREEDVRAVADAIRAKNESTETYTLSEMADAIRAIETKAVAPLIVHSFVEDDVLGGEGTYKSITVAAENIGEYAFSSCYGLETAELVGVTSIGEYAFQSCESLTSLTIPDSLTSIGEYAFEYCSNLTDITIPDSVTEINSGTFRYCSSLKSISIGNGVTSIGDYAFTGCTSLTGIIIPDNTRNIASGAFQSCSSLSSVIIPQGIESIAHYTFYECDELTEINYKGTVAEWTALNTQPIVGYGKVVTVHCTDGDTTAMASTGDD